MPRLSTVRVWASDAVDVSNSYMYQQALHLMRRLLVLCWLDACFVCEDSARLCRKQQAALACLHADVSERPLLW
jgi:hypothetical protein